MGNISDIQQIVVDSAKILGAAFRTKNSVLNAVGFLGPVLDLKSANFAAALTELKNLSSDDIKALELAFRSNVDLGDAVAQAKFDELEGYLEEAITLVQEALMLVQQGLAWEQQVQGFFGL